MIHPAQHEPLVPTTVRLPKTLMGMVNEAAHSLHLDRAVFIRQALTASIAHWKTTQCPAVIQRLQCIMGR
jgi:predicted transcriptional regulator